MRMILAVSLMVPLFFHSPAYGDIATSEGEAPCTVGNGYQTIRFDNGVSYSGQFLNCAPQPGQAVLVDGETTISGYAEPINSSQVRLEFDGGEVIISVVTVR